MKKLIAITALVLMGSVQAALPTANSSWSTISNDFRVWSQFATVLTQGGMRTKVSSLCDNGDSYRTKNVVSKCTKWSRTNHGQQGRVCLERTSMFDFVNYVGSKKVCVKWERQTQNAYCAEYATRSFEVASSYDVKVFKKTKNYPRPSYDKVLFTKRFDIPSCK